MKNLTEPPHEHHNRAMAVADRSLYYRTVTDLRDYLMTGSNPYMFDSSNMWVVKVGMFSRQLYAQLEEGTGR